MIIMVINCVLNNIVQLILMLNYTQINIFIITFNYRQGCKLLEHGACDL